MSTKVATAVLEIRTDTSAFKKDLKDAGAQMSGLGDIAKRLGASLSAFAKGFDTAGESSQKMAKRTKDDTDQMVQSFNNAGVSFGKLVGSYITAQAIMNGVSTVWHAVTGEIASSIKAAGDAEKAHVQLVAALRAQGTAVPSVISAYNGYASALQRTTIFQDDAIEGAAALLVQIGNVMPRDMEKALKATTNLASGLGIDLESATRIVAKAAEGNTSALQKAGVVIDDTTKKSGDFGKVLDKVTEKFGGQAEAIAGTYQGRLQQLNNTWNNLEESIGRAITQNATVLAVLAELNGEIDRNTGELKDNQAVTNFVSDAVLILVRSIASLASAMDTIQTVGAGFMITIRNMGSGLGNIAIFALEAAKGLAAISGGGIDIGLDKPIQALKDAVAELGRRNEVTTGHSVALGNALSGIEEKATALEARLQKTRGQTIELKDATDKSTTAWDNHTKAVASATDAHNAFADAMKELNSVGQGWQGTLDTVDGDTVESVKYFRQAGIELGVLATAYGLTDAQVKAIDESMKAEALASKALLELHNNLEAGLFGLTKAFDGADDSVLKLAKTMEALKMAERSVPSGLPGFESPNMSGLENVGFKSTDPADAGRAAAKMGKSFTTQLGEAFQKIPDLLVAAFTGGGGVMGAIKGFGTMIGGAFGGSLFGSLKDGKVVGGLFKGVTGMFASVIPAIGPAIGALIGPLIAKIAALFDHDGADIMHHVGAGWGVKLSDGLRDAIVKDMKDKGLTEVAATMMHMGDIIKEAGGLNAGNLDRFTARLHDTFSMIETHQLTIAQGTKILEDNWAAFAEAGTDASGRISEGLKEIIRLDQQFGTQSKQISAFLKQQGADALDAFVDIVGGSEDAAAGYAAIRASVDATSKTALTSADVFQKALGSMGKAERSALDAGMAGFKGSAAEFLAQQASLYQFAKEGDEKLKTWLSADTMNAIKNAGGLSDAFAGVVSGMGATERDALLAGMGDFKGTVSEFLAQQAALYEHAAEGDLRLKTWLSAETLATIKALPAAQAFVDALAAQQKAAEAARQELSDLGIQAVASFAAAVASGMSVTDALIKIHPALATLEKDYEDLGIAVDDVALAALMMQDKILTANPKLVKAVAGLSKEMIALSNMGLLNADTFAAIERTGAQMYARLQGEVQKIGGTTKDALLPMQDYLHQAEEQAKLLGVALDPFDQMLIDQSKELGIWRDKGKSAMDTLIDKVTDLINTLLGIPRHIDIDGTVTWDYGNAPTGPPSSNTTGNEPTSPSGPTGSQSEGGFATGTPGYDFMDFGIKRATTLHGEEAVVPRGGGHELATEIAAALGASALQQQPTISNFNTKIENNISALDPRTFHELLDREGIPYIIGEVDNNRRGIRRQLREAMGVA